MSRLKKILITLILVITLTVSIPIISAKQSNVANQNDLVNNQSSVPTDYQFKSNKYTQKEEAFSLAINEFIPVDGYEFLGKNDTANISIYANKEDLSFKILEHNTNYWWSSKIDTAYLDDVNSPLNDEGDLGASAFLQRKMKSPLLVSYYIGNLKKEESLFDSPGSSFTYTKLTGNKIGFESKVRFAVSGISLSFSVYIDDNGLNVELPFESVLESESTKLSNVVLYKYFGATKRNRISGYTFIPDGVGALKRFDDENTGIYNKRFYGTDPSLVQQKETEQELMANLYGVVHGVDQNAFINIIDKGSSYANLVLTSSRSEDDFNKTYISFEYRVLYTQYLNAKKTNSVKMIQEDANEYDVKMILKFLSNQDANYIGMADLYQDHLELKELNDDISTIKLHLNVLAAENRQTLFGKKTFSMTKVSELTNIIKELEAKGISNVDVTYHGWTNIGYSNSNVKYKRINKRIGSKNDIKELVALLKDNLYFTVDYTHGYKDARGYSSKDVVQAIDQSLITNQTGQQYLLNTTFAINQLTKDLSKFSKLNISNLAFDNLSNELYGNFIKGGINREDAIVEFKELIDLANKNAVAKPYSYLWYADMIYDIPMYSSNHARFSDTVPFIPLVLSGATVYGRANNFFSNVENELLRIIDYNIYPSFYITHESSNLLLETNSSNIYTSRFTDWKDSIVEQYNFVNDALSHVTNAKMIERKVVDTGLVKNTYSNNVVIYVNYSNNTYITDGITINKTSYEVVK